MRNFVVDRVNETLLRQYNHKNLYKPFSIQFVNVSNKQRYIIYLFLLLFASKNTYNFDLMNSIIVAIFFKQWNLTCMIPFQSLLLSFGEWKKKKVLKWPYGKTEKKNFENNFQSDYHQWFSRENDF